MSDKSPLFVSSIESLAHATELYSQGNERKFKFVVLHLAHAVELILKDHLIDKGVSIYLPKKAQTIGIWDAFDELDRVGVTIPERPIIELLVDDRNTLQHRFGFPNAETVYYYLERVVAFFKRYLDDEYGVDLTDVLKLHLSKEDLALLGLVEGDEGAAATLDKLFELSPEAAILEAYNAIESKVLELRGDDSSAPPQRILSLRADPYFSRLLSALEKGGFVPKDSETRFAWLQQMRNQAAHKAHVQNEIAPEKWAKALQIAKDILLGMEEASTAGDLTERDQGATATGEDVTSVSGE